MNRIRFRLDAAWLRSVAFTNHAASCETCMAVVESHRAAPDPEIDVGDTAERCLDLDIDAPWCGAGRVLVERVAADVGPSVTDEQKRNYVAYLRERLGVSTHSAKLALARCGWDLDRAHKWIEKVGRTR